MIRRRAEHHAAPALLLLLVLLLAAPAPAVQAAPAAELIVNGGFEAGTTGWDQFSSAGHPLIDGFFVLAGQYAADLAGQNTTQDRISQRITLPAGQPARLDFWWALRTDESGGEFDTLQVNVLSAGGALLGTLATFNNASLEPYTWDRGSFSLAPYAGQPVQIQFAAQTDQNNPTQFFIDNVSVRTLQPSFLPFVRR